MVKKKVKRSYYESLYEIASEINSARTPESVLGSIVEMVAEALGAKACSIMLLTPDRKQLLHTAAYGLSDWYIRKGPYAADKSIAETLMGGAVTILNASSDERMLYPEQQQKEGAAVKKGRCPARQGGRGQGGDRLGCGAVRVHALRG